MCTPENKKMPVDLKRLAKDNAVRYLRYKDRFDDIDIAELNEFRAEVHAAYSRLVSTGIDVQVAYHDPYKNLEELSSDIFTNNVLQVSGLHNDSKLLPGELNLKFRAVHDFLHYFLQQPFGFAGEYKVYQAQKHIHKSKLRRQILYSEVVLQAAYCEYYGRFAEKQKIVLL